MGATRALRGRLSGKKPSGKKRGEYSHNACDDCKKKKVKCTPESRNWPAEKCDRCVEKHLNCSAIRPFQERSESTISSQQLLQDCLLCLNWYQMLSEIYDVAKNIDIRLSTIAKTDSTKLLRTIKRTRLREHPWRICDIILNRLNSLQTGQIHTSSYLVGPGLSVHDEFVAELAITRDKNDGEIIEKYRGGLQSTWNSILDVVERYKIKHAPFQLSHWNDLEHFTNPNFTKPFIYEFSFSDSSVVDSVVEYEEEKAIDEGLTCGWDNLGRTALHYATSILPLNSAEFFNYFPTWHGILTSSIDINSRDLFGRTPLHIACALDLCEEPGMQCQVVGALLKANADLSCVDGYGLLAIDYAVRGNRIEIVELFQKVRNLNLTQTLSAMGRVETGAREARHSLKIEMGL
ncbi:hypothetical protein F4802DRAFT_595237 [Xylaria palmicola]|nr:hypothetical protein F4802DRAFT_595237 [Xylaria palmicola]